MQVRIDAPIPDRAERVRACMLKRLAAAVAGSPMRGGTREPAGFETVYSAPLRQSDGFTVLV